MILKHGLAAALCFAATGLVAAPGGVKGAAPGSGQNPAGNGGFVQVAITTETQTIFMGMSDRLAPNARAAASQGTRVETTTTTTTINGPKGQVENYVAGNSTDCNNCTITQVSVTELTSLPGKAR